MPFPLMLAGPILRRVEPTLVTVWVALRESGTLELNLWNGVVKDDGGSPLFSGPANQLVTNAISNTSATIRIGDQLHIGLVTIRFPPDKPLLPHLTYSYNITLTTASGTHDLKSLGLLKTGDIEGKPNLAMGYATNFLPSFSLTPVEITDLRILHGSCRRINRNVPDGLAWVDDFIESSRSDPKTRPHQLLLSGDQIYADDINAPLLEIIIDPAKKLIGTQNDPSGKPVPLEELPIGDKLFLADELRFPPGYRFSLTINHAKLSSKDGTSHLLSLGEFCAMYLIVWSNTCWPEKLPTEAEIKSRVQLTIDRIRKLPPELRPHLLGRTEKGALITSFRLGEIPEADLQTILGPDQKFTPWDLSKKQHRKEKRDAIKNREEGPSKEVLLLKQLWEALPKVRRALANVPTYMMFDDHEVTDDWYLNPMWRDRVLTNPLGRTIVRNGLISYALFQAWGNDPLKFESGDNKKLLDESTKLFLPNTTGPNEAVGTEIDRLLGLNLRDPLETPPVKWHYSVKGSRHLLIAIDNRTRRSFVSRIGPPSNLSPAALEEQIPAGPLEAGLEVLILIAPLPVIGPPMLDELVAPLVYRIFDIRERNNLEKQEGTKGMAGTDPDAIEAWAFDPIATEALLKRLETYRRVVILSGDVHNGSSQSMSYWKKGDTDPAVFAQFTSSGMKNVMPWYLRFIDRSFATAQKIIRADIGTERMGWNVANPTPLTFPANAEIAASLLSRLRHEPVLIPSEGWPDGTITNRAPDFQWRAKALRDPRPDLERPEPAKVDPFNSGNTDVTPNLDGYRQVLVRHAKQLTNMVNSRQILFANNLGRVRFEQQGQTLVAIQELYTSFPFVGAQTLEKPALFTLHKVPLTSPGEQTPEQDLNEPES